MSEHKPAIFVEISPGELLDKLGILSIKLERIVDAAKLANVQREFALLDQIRERHVPDEAETNRLSAGLREINARLWTVEDDLRLCERNGDFGPQFVELARSVYRLNDERALLKRQINEHLGSRLVEEKSYVRYGDPPD